MRNIPHHARKAAAWIRLISQRQISHELGRVHGGLQMCRPFLLRQQLTVFVRICE